MNPEKSDAPNLTFKETALNVVILRTAFCGCRSIEYELLRDFGRTDFSFGGDVFEELVDELFNVFHDDPFLGRRFRR